MEKYIELKKGTFERDGKEYDYIVEIPEGSLKKKAGNIRLRVIEERPAIHKIRTRYDPDITMYGDKNASMELLLGYDMKEIKASLKRLLFTLISPFYVAGIILLMESVDKMPEYFIPAWLSWTLISVAIILSLLFFKLYYKINMMMLAEYLKARDLKKLLKNRGFKQDGMDTNTF